LKNFVVFKGIFQIPVGWEIDEELVRDLVYTRLAELESKYHHQRWWLAVKPLEGGSFC
jgi:hypothetical protein